MSRALRRAAFLLVFFLPTMVAVGTFYIFQSRRPAKLEPATEETAPARAPAQKSLSENEDHDARSRDALITAGTQYLLAQQGEDGGWHSDTYGALRGGASITALVLYSMSHLPEPVRREHDRALRRGWEFLQLGFEQQGFVCNPDGSADYPTYATAMAFVAAKKLGWKLEQQLEDRFVDYLVSSQLTEGQGWTPDDEHYGGWDMAGGSTATGKRITTGTNLSVTSYALEALALSSSPAAAVAREKAATWLERCQNFPGDGGFVFSPIDSDSGNKAGATDNGPVSYGTMTADGLRALLSLGAFANVQRVEAATSWLANEKQLDVVPGFAGQSPGVDPAWQHDLRFYYYASRAQVAHLKPELQTLGLQQELLETLKSLQLDDGRWANPSPTARMREDDPLIATSLALIALAPLQAR